MLKLAIVLVAALAVCARAYEDTGPRVKEALEKLTQLGYSKFMSANEVRDFLDELSQEQPDLKSNNLLRGLMEADSVSEDKCTAAHLDGISSSLRYYYPGALASIIEKHRAPQMGLCIDKVFKPKIEALLAKLDPEVRGHLIGLTGHLLMAHDTYTVREALLVLKKYIEQRRYYKSLTTSPADNYKLIVRPMIEAVKPFRAEIQELCDMHKALASELNDARVNALQVALMLEDTSSLADELSQAHPDDEALSSVTAVYGLVSLPEGQTLVSTSDEVGAKAVKEAIRNYVPPGQKKASYLKAKLTSQVKPKLGHLKSDCWHFRAVYEGALYLHKTGFEVKPTANFNRVINTEKLCQHIIALYEASSR